MNHSEDSVVVRSVTMFACEILGYISGTKMCIKCMEEDFTQLLGLFSYAPRLFLWGI